MEAKNSHKNMESINPILQDPKIYLELKPSIIKNIRLSHVP